MGARLYDPTTGRFLQPDPVPSGSANDYDYANQDPINNRDLDGRMVRDTADSVCDSGCPKAIAATPRSFFKERTGAAPTKKRRKAAFWRRAAYQALRGVAAPVYGVYYQAHQFNSS